MKKILTALCVSSLLLLCSCGISKEAQAVIDNINSIEEIDVTDIDLIKETSEMYNSLSDEDKEKVENYSVLQEAEKKLPELEKELAIQNDKTPPTFSGMKENEVIKVKCGTTFNLNDYLADKITITDDVTEGKLEYQTELDEKIYESITGKVDTQYSGEYPIILSSKDEAGNEGKFNLKLKLSPIHVTKKNPTPTVYDGEYGTIKIKSFEHDDKYGSSEYRVTFDVTNKTDKYMVVCITGDTYINDFQIPTYNTEGSIAPGKRGYQESSFYDSEIPEDVGKITTIESDVGLKSGDEYFFFIPIILDVNVSK